MLLFQSIAIFSLIMLSSSLLPNLVDSQPFLNTGLRILFLWQRYIYPTIKKIKGIGMKSFEEAMKFRHACKLFDESRKIDRNDLLAILEAGRQSPSSFGAEPWHFLVIESDKIKALIRPACRNQPQVTTCSHYLIILYLRPHLFNTVSSEYLHRSLKRHLGDNNEAIQGMILDFDNHRKNVSRSNDESWSIMQTYIAGANIMTAAATRSIDSCAIEGFEYKQLEALLIENVPEYNANDYGVSLCIALGYRINPQSPQVRWDLDDLVTIV